VIDRLLVSHQFGIIKYLNFLKVVKGQYQGVKHFNQLNYSQKTEMRFQNTSHVSLLSPLSGFHSWLEELESEVIAFTKKTNSSDPMDLAEGLGLSRSGADFLVTKLKREGKI